MSKDIILPVNMAEFSEALTNALDSINKLRNFEFIMPDGSKIAADDDKAFSDLCLNDLSEVSKRLFQTPYNTPSG